jgi:hypothetical protein
MCAHGIGPAIAEKRSAAGLAKRLNAASICHLSKSVNERGVYTNTRCHAVRLAAKFLLLQATVGIRLAIGNTMGTL